MDACSFCWVSLGIKLENFSNVLVKEDTWFIANQHKSLVFQTLSTIPHYHFHIHAWALFPFSLARWWDIWPRVWSHFVLLSVLVFFESIWCKLNDHLKQGKVLEMQILVMQFWSNVFGVICLSWGQIEFFFLKLPA